MRGAAHPHSPCGLRVERAPLQAAFPGPGEPAGAGGTGSECCAEGEVGAPANPCSSPAPKGEGFGFESPSVFPPLFRLGFSPSVTLLWTPIPTGATWARARHDYAV